MPFGIYIHIPYCLQICTYCDFAKYEEGKIPPKEHYLNLILNEIRQKQQVIPKDIITSVYFGGGTPSLFPPNMLNAILEELKKYFIFSKNIEITLEINPGTISEFQLFEHLDMGINRYSVGVQTFNENLLKITKRKHSAQETLDTLKLLKTHTFNYSVDILYALPGQNKEDLINDLSLAMEFNPSHVSCYYLTVPENHKLNHGRASDDEQSEMMDTLEAELKKYNILRYEISNFSAPGKESLHNLLYWTDNSYWGVGLGAHSYIKTANPWGTRFWNSGSYSKYQKNIETLGRPLTPYDGLPTNQIEILKKNQALTDYCHTFLRRVSGLDIRELEKKFLTLPKTILPALSLLQDRGLIDQTGFQYRLSTLGKKLPNVVFEALTFLQDDF